MGLVRERLENSSCRAYLKGATGTRTRNETRIDGEYNFKYRAHQFKIKVSGQYVMYVDRDRNGIFYINTSWSDANGNFLPGDDFTKHMEGHGSGSGSTIATEDILNKNVSPAKTSFAEDF